MLQRTTLALSVLLSLVLLAPVSVSQIFVSEVQVSSSVRLPSVIGDGPLAYVSQFGSSIQSIWTIANPTAPTPLSSDFNPNFGDQWNHAHHYRGPEGSFLFQACRFGGLNMLDVSVPTAITAVDSEQTNYHWNGIETFKNPFSGTLYLAVSEAVTSVAGVGGILLYEVTASGMTLVASALRPLVQGFDLKFSPDGQYLYQLGTYTWNPSHNSNLLVYDLGSPSIPSYPSPVLIADPVIGQVPASSTVELVVADGGNRLYMAMDDLGLWTADVRNPAVPQLTQLFSLPGVRFRHLSRFKEPGDVYVGSFAMSTPYQDHIFALRIPEPYGGPAGVRPMLVAPTGMAINSVDADSERVYVSGAKPGIGVLQIWR